MCILNIIHIFYTCYQIFLIYLVNLVITVTLFVLFTRLVTYKGWITFLAYQDSGLFALIKSLQKKMFTADSSPHDYSR